MKYWITFVFLFVFIVSPVHAQNLQVLDYYDDNSGEMTLNLSRITQDLSSYELFIDNVSYGVFTQDQSAVTIPTPSIGEHRVDITVTSRFSGAQGKVAFILNIIPSEEVPFFVPIPEFLQDIARAVVDLIPGGQSTVNVTTIVSILSTGASSAIAATSLFTSIGEFISYLIHIFFSILEFFGLRKKSKPWGTVYNSITKQPIPYAKVTLLDEHSRVLETKITDKEGRYGFLVAPESLTGEGMSIQLKAEKNKFTFPSQKVTPPKDTVLYENVYNGGIVKIQTASAANFDIPLDPLELTAKEVAKLPSMKFHNAFTKVADFGFWVGLVTTPLSFIADPNILSFSILVIFFVLAFFRIFGLKEKPYGVVVDDTQGRPMPFALITLNDKQGARKGFTVSDERGRYFLVTERGEFDVNVYTPADITPQRTNKTHLSAKRGWIAEELHI